MHILMISRCPPYPLHLGDRLIIYHLARELTQRGHTLDLLAYANQPDDWHTDWAVVAPYFREIRLYPEPQRTPMDYLRRVLIAAARFPRRAEESWSPGMWAEIEGRLTKGEMGKPDYEVVHMFGGVQVYEFWGALGDVPAIITPYESYSLYLRRVIEHSKPSPPTPLPQGEGSKWRAQIGFPSGAELMARAKNRLQLLMARRFESFMFTPYQRTVVVSARDKAELLGIHPALNIDVIPNGIDLVYFRLQNETRDSATLLFTGNYEYTPNVDAALRLVYEVLPEVRKVIPSVRLWLVGNAPPPELEALASDCITVTGRVPDVRPYLAQATVFVSPLRLGAGIKNKILEALAMGLPVVATPLSVDGIGVRHGESALITDERQMVNHVIRLLQDAELRRKLSESGRVLIEEQYSWARVAALYEALYQQMQG